MPGIFAREGDVLVPLEESEYETESVLQDLLSSFPELLVDAAGPDAGYLLIGAEVPFDGAGPSGGPGYIDHVFVNHEGVPTLVEVKRSSDSRIRREVVGQMLDYAASVRGQWGGGYLRAHFESKNHAADDAVRERLPSVSGIDEFWGLVAKNIDAGRLRILFVADKVPESLRKIIEFLNEQMSRTEVLAIEVRQYIDADQTRQLLVPEVVGHTAASRDVKNQRSGAWDRESFFAQLGSTGDADALKAGKRIFEWADSNPELQINYGSGKKEGSFQFGSYEPYAWPINIYSYGSLEISFEGLKNRPPFDSEQLRLELHERLIKIPGVDIDPERIGKRPNVKLALFASDSSFDALVETVEWIFDQAKSGQAHQTSIAG